jgi:hypothetical protein
MLDQPYMTDLIEANSMGHEPNLIDIYSASWGPTDDGKTVDGPRNATMRAIVRGVNEVSLSFRMSIIAILRFYIDLIDQLNLKVAYSIYSTKEGILHYVQATLRKKIPV